MELNDLIHLHSITVVLVHNPHASDALKVFATRLMNYEEFIKDVEPPHNRQVWSICTYIILCVGNSITLLYSVYMCGTQLH